MSNISGQILTVLRRYLASTIATSLLDWIVRQTHIRIDDPERLSPGDQVRVLKILEQGTNLYVVDAEEKKECLVALRALLSSSGGDPAQVQDDVILLMEERDIMVARVAALRACESLGFRQTTTVKIVTVVSELARNIIAYAGGGRIELSTVVKPHSGIRILAIDGGSGIHNLDDIMAGNYKSKTGMGRGILAAKKLMDKFEIKTGPGKGTKIAVVKFLEDYADR